MAYQHINTQLAEFFARWLPASATAPLLSALSVDAVNDLGVAGEVRTWEVKSELQLFGLPVRLRLVVMQRQRGTWEGMSGGSRAVLRLWVQGPLVPSQIIQGLLLDGAHHPSALDFLSLDQPTLYLSNYDTGDAGFSDPELDAALQLNPAPRRLANGVTVFGVVPNTDRLDRTPKSLTRPLYYLLNDTNALPAGLELSVDAEAVTGLVRMARPLTLVDEEALKIRLSGREAGFFLLRSDSRIDRSTQAKSPPERTTQAAPEPTKKQEVTLASDVDVTITPGAVGLPFPKADTARLRVGAAVAEDTQGTGSAEGWLRLRDEARPWEEPFGLPGLTVSALYAKLDLAKKELRAFRGDAEFAGQTVDFAARLTAEREGCLIALRLRDKTPLLGVGAALLGRTTSTPADGLYIEGLGPRDGAPEDPVKPEDYNLYVTNGEQQLDERAYPPGLRVQGKLHVWKITSAEVDLGVSWGDGPVRFEGRGLSLNLGGADFSIHLGELVNDMPFKVLVTEDLQVDFEVDYDLSFAGIHVAGAAKLSDAGVSFGLPSGGKAITDQLRLTSLKTEGSGLSAVVMGLELSRSVKVPVPSGLPGGLDPLPGTGVVEAVGALSLELVAGTSYESVGLRAPKVRGSVHALGLKTGADIALHVSLDVGDIEGWAEALEHALAEWAADALQRLVGDLLGNLPVIGPLLTEVFGFAQGAIGALLVSADSLGVLPAVSGGIKESLKLTGVALGEVDEVLAGAMDWAHGEGLALGRQAGHWVAGGVELGTSAVVGTFGDWINAISFDVSDLSDLGKKVADKIGKGAGKVLEDTTGWLGLSGLHPAPPDDGSAYDASSSGRADDAHEAVAAAGVALFFQMKDFGGRSLALPLGRFPLPKSGDHRMWRDANSVLLPRGWAFRLWDSNGNVSGWFNKSTRNLREWTDRATEVEISPLGNVIFYTDAKYSGASAGQMGAGTYSIDQQASSVLIPPGWTVYMTRSDDRVAKLTGSVNSFKQMISGESWNDQVVTVKVLSAPDRRGRWRSATAPRLCSGVASGWRDALGGGVELTVDLSGYPFAAPPAVFTSLEGHSSHNAVYGVSCRFAPRSDSFQVRVHRKLGDPARFGGATDITAALAKSWGWRLNWVALAKDEAGALTGQTRDFADYPEGGGVKVALTHGEAEVDGQAPPAFASLAVAWPLERLSWWFQRWNTGDYRDQEEAARLSPWAIGIGASYHAHKGSFQTYIKLPDQPPMPQHWRWSLDWTRPLFGHAGALYDGLRGCAGRTAEGQGWQAHTPRTLKLRVDTSAARLAGEVRYISALSGQLKHWETLGGSSIYAADADGFTVYVSFFDGRPLSPADAEAWGWHMHWMATATAQRADDARAPVQGLPANVERPLAQLPDERHLGRPSGEEAAWGQVGPEAWEDADDEYITTYVDLSKRGFKAPPRVFTSMGGGSSSYAARGVNGVYDLTARGFRVKVGLKLDGSAGVDGQTGMTPALARKWGWRLNWVALGDGVPLTTYGEEDDWQAYGDGDGVYVSAQQVVAPTDGQHTPAFASLHGRGRQSWLTGGNASYDLKSAGFTTYVRQLEGETRVADAQAWRWSLSWCRPRFGLTGVRSGPGTLRAGRTPPGVGWEACSANTLQLRVDTSGAGIQGAPVYLSAISGTSSHWEAIGASAVHEADATGFTVYVAFLGGRSLTPEMAQSWGWCVHWMAASSG